MSNNAETVDALRSAAREIHSLRRQVVEVKAEAWDVHSEVIKRLFSGSGAMAPCPAWQAETLAARIEEAGKQVSPPSEI